MFGSMQDFHFCAGRNIDAKASEVNATSITCRVYLGVASLVDELLDSLQIRVAPSNIGLHKSQHIHCGLVHLKHASH